MLFLYSLLVLISWTTAENKTKRTVSQDLYNFGETNPVLTYDNLAPKPVTYFNLPQPIKEYEQPFGIKQATQPIPYEYQQHPANIYAKQPQPLQPNNNFNQQFQNRYQEPASSTTNLQNFMPSEAVILPQQGQHPLYENNGQFTPNNKFNSPYNAQQSLPKKYIHPVSARFIYNQHQLPYLHHPQINRDAFLPSQQLPPIYNTHQFQQRLERPVNADYHNSHLPRQNIIAPNINSKIVASQRKQPLHANFSPKAPVNKEEDKSDDDTPVKQSDEASTNEDNLDEDDSSEHQEQDPAYSKYSFDYEENENYDKGSSEADDSDEGDSKRDTKTSRKHPKKNSKKEAVGHNTEKRRDGNSKRGRSETEKSTRKPKMMYKSVKYSREVNRNPKADFLEGRHTENVPVTHKHRFFKEKWYLSKNMENDHEAI